MIMLLQVYLGYMLGHHCGFLLNLFFINYFCFLLVLLFFLDREMLALESKLGFGQNWILLFLY